MDEFEKCPLVRLHLRLHSLTKAGQESKRRFLACFTKRSSKEFTARASLWRRVGCVCGRGTGRRFFQKPPCAPAWGQQKKNAEQGKLPSKTVVP